VATRQLLAAPDGRPWQGTARSTATVPFTRRVGGPKLSDYGTAKAQDYLRKWAKEYGPKPQPEAGARESKP